MTIPKITPYTGGVANPDGSQTQAEFTQNMFDQLSYEANLSTELNSTVDGINETATQVDASAASASQSAANAEAAASGLDYQGLWPDAGGSANKGDTYQTQVGGTPTGQYFTALQSTTVDPVGDDVNWREVVSASYVDDKNQLQDVEIQENAQNISEIGSSVEQQGLRISINESDISALQAGQGSGVVAFATQAELFANLDFDESYVAYVTNDPTATNNGTYRKVGASGSGSWDQSSLDIASQAYQNSIQNEHDLIPAKAILELQKAKPIHQIADAMGNIVSEIDSESNLKLYGLGDSVQSEILNLKARSELASTYPTDAISATIDALGNVVRKINKDGNEIHANCSPVFNSLNIIKPTNKRNSFSDASINLLSRLPVFKSCLPPCAWLLMPNDYGIPDSFINAFNLDLPAQYTPLDSPYARDDDVVHPYVIELPTNFLGYKFIMAQTPYYTGSQENAVLYGSHDSDNWEMISECPKPLYPSPLNPDYAHQSDNCLAYDPVNGFLYVVWRRTRSIGGTGDEWDWQCRYTENGIVWSDVEVITPPNLQADNLSPTFLYNPNDSLWHVFYGNAAVYVTHATSKNITGPYTIQSDQPLANMWHSETKFMGDKYVMLSNNRNGGQLNFLVSADGDNWTVGSDILNTSFTGMYKTSFLPLFDGNNLTFKMFMATNNTGGHPFEHKFLINTTNTVDVTTL